MGTLVKARAMEAGGLGCVRWRKPRKRGGGEQGGDSGSPGQREGGDLPLFCF